MSFAAVELKTHLEQTLTDVRVWIDEKAEEGAFNVRLIAKDHAVLGEEYSLVPEQNGLCIEGRGRAGVLYGVYEWLKMQGWRWYSPGKEGTYPPPRKDDLVLPSETQTYRSTAPVGRGFSLDGRLNENEELFLWMARNRLNVFFNYPNSCRLIKKLGFIVRDGGHIFEEILKPDRILPSGKTVWEEHTEWFGLPEDGVKTKEKAQNTQFCVSEPDCLDFLCEEILSHTMNEWREADEINVWGFDTWGGVCTCERCKKLGNATDQLLFMISRFRDYLNKARREKRLDRDVRMVLCSYEGSGSLQPPLHAVPQNLIDAGDHCLFAPIVRCYAHKFDDTSCSYNSEYNDALCGWHIVRPNLPMSILEYYNVSKFEDLPLLFLHTMQHDFRHYYDLGVRGFCYMHIPMVNWGVRALTQVLFAELSWNINVDVDKVLDEYFCHRYGEHADSMRRIYALIDEASREITSWRAWKERSLLSKLMAWDGDIPKEPLPIDDHFSTPEMFEKIGRETEQKWQVALDLLSKEILKEKNTPHAILTMQSAAVNPEQLRKAQCGDKILKCLTEDKRGLIYGVDTYRLSLRMGQYYNALYEGNGTRADALWKEIEGLTDKLESYYMPITFSGDFLGMMSRDALTRTQLADTVVRCRQYRLRNGRNGTL